MNAFEQILFWCFVQVTVMAVAALVIGAIIGRRRPAAGAVVAAAALTAIIGLSAMAISPWPAWPIGRDGQAWSQAIGTPKAVADNPVPLPTAIASNRPAFDEAGHEASAPMELMNPREQSASFLSRSWRALIGNWGVLLAVIYLIGVAGMALRIGLGLAAVRGYRRNSRPITDPRLGELLDVVCAELGCCHDVELRETAQLATPATIGWGRPMLLLPNDWPSWTVDERHAVLAHEIAHVRRGDFVSWMFAQIGVALHFYHPLVHWLANRLRLEQELAADAAAARVVGGQRKYVTTLAAMALRQSDVPAAWPARAFLPTSKTFLRRIEMLHRSKSIHSDVSRPLVFSSVAAIALAAVCAAGFRGSAVGDDRSNAGDGSATTVALQEPNPSIQVTPDTAANNAVNLNHLKQLALAMHNYYGVHKSLPPAIVMGPDGKTPHSWRIELLPYLDQKLLYEQYRMNEPWDSANNRRVLERIPEVFKSPYDDPQSKSSGYYVLVGPGTMFEGNKGIKFQDVIDGTSNTLMIVDAKRDIPWTKPEDIPFDPDKPLPKLGGFVKGQFSAATADGFTRRYDAEQAKDQLKWLIVRNDHYPIDRKKLGPDQERLPQPTNISRPARDADKISRSKNNLKQLGLAMHNYHDVFGHFPPAVVMGPDGKTPRSWRVDLLPFVEGASLYNQYRKDEPWDGPNNKKLIDKMPDVFRSPYDDPKSTNSGYYVLVGPGTAFEGSKGIQLREISDGTSNTLLIVEAKRNIPWTKPEDISFDPDKPLPELGGFLQGEFTAVMADGRALPFQTDQIKDQLKWLIIRNDGHPVELP